MWAGEWQKKITRPIAGNNNTFFLALAKNNCNFLGTKLDDDKVLLSLIESTSALTTTIADYRRSFK